MEKKGNLLNIVALYGILFALLIAAQVFVTATIEPNSMFSTILSVAMLALSILIPFMAVKAYKNQTEQMSIGKALKVAVLVGLAGGFLGGLYAMVYYKFINPEGIDRVMEISREAIEKMGLSTDPDLVDKQMEMTRKMFIPGQFGGALFSGLLYGVIGGVIGGLVYKSDSEEY